MANYQRKTRDRWDILVNYGYGDGWEWEISEYTRKEAREQIKSYRENTNYAVRLEKHREKIEA